MQTHRTIAFLLVPLLAIACAPRGYDGDCVRLDAVGIPYDVGQHSIACENSGERNHSDGRWDDRGAVAKGLRAQTRQRTIGSPTADAWATHRLDVLTRN